ncbi:hypothetical protein, partial [Pseudomonas amygdali]
MTGNATVTRFGAADFCAHVFSPHMNRFGGVSALSIMSRAAFTRICVFSAMKTPLLPFEPVTLAELRLIWNAHPAPECRRMALEIMRYRKVLAEVDDLYQTVHQSWRENVGGDLMALHLFKQHMHNEQLSIAGIVTYPLTDSAHGSTTLPLPSYSLRQPPAAYRLVWCFT